MSASPLRFTHQLHLNTCLVATAFAVKSLSPVTSIKCQLQPSKPHFKPSFRVTFPPVSPPTCISTYASPPWYNLVSTLCPPNLFLPTLCPPCVHLGTTLGPPWVHLTYSSLPCVHLDMPLAFRGSTSRALPRTLTSRGTPSRRLWRTSPSTWPVRLRPR